MTNWCFLLQPLIDFFYCSGSSLFLHFVFFGGFEERGGFLMANVSAVSQNQAVVVGHDTGKINLY